MSDGPAQNRGQTIRTGIAGEFFVAGELTKRGWIASLTAKNTPDVDELASRPTGDVHARIQVKTRSPAYAYAHRVGDPSIYKNALRHLASVNDWDAERVKGYLAEVQEEFRRREALGEWTQDFSPLLGTSQPTV